MESWLKEEINNTEVFIDGYTTFRRTGVLEVVECSFGYKIHRLQGAMGR